jgi:ubiquinone/menaquinone biosynthesis C-methylase UbiE
MPHQNATGNQSPVFWPPLEEELKDYLPYLKGKVLNAGSGKRDLSPFIDGEVFNQDLPGSGALNLHLAGSIERIPKPDAFFDGIICNSVLYALESPFIVVKEFQRVLKPGGYLYICMPFMQPQLSAADYWRCGPQGLSQLVENNGFKVLKSGGVHSVYHTLGWLVHEWLRSSDCLMYKFLRAISYPVIRYLTKHSKTQVPSMASAYRVLAIKN